MIIVLAYFIILLIILVHDKSKNPASNLTKAIVFDLEKVVKHGDIIHPILEYKAGSFFELNTIPQGSDLIFINGVLHDWNDEECQIILKNAAKSLTKDGRIMVVDLATPGSVQEDPMFNTKTKFDVFMMTITSGFFRTKSEYNKLWQDSSLTLVEVRPTRSLNTLWILSP